MSKKKKSVIEVHTSHSIYKIINTFEQMKLPYSSCLLNIQKTDYSKLKKLPMYRNFTRNTYNEKWQFAWRSKSKGVVYEE